MSTEVNPIFGYVPSPPDSRDKTFAELLPALTVATDISDYVIPEKTPISDQTNTGTCVANASMDALEILMGIEGITVEQLSRLFAYWLGRLLSGSTSEDKGTFIRAVFSQMRNIGVCLEKTWPFQPWDTIPVKGIDTPRIFAPPTSTAYMEADSNRIEGYYSITSYDIERLNDMEAAIRANHPVVLATGVTKSFQQFKGGSVLFPPANDADVIGMHAMIAMGVRWRNGRRQFLLRNSWSDRWGETGHAWVDESYMTWYKTSDLWVPTKINPILKAA